ncbi:MAG TPA: Ig-like domain repeat protein [Chloroflexia bacterium]|nr:Ig-like domain repeat protein [Chloroflexia bacterium]
MSVLLPQSGSYKVRRHRPARRSLLLAVILSFTSLLASCWPGYAPVLRAAGIISVGSNGYACSYSGLTAAITAAGSGGTVNFDPTCNHIYFGGNSAITLGADLTIDGTGVTGGLVLDGAASGGGSNTQLFIINSGVTVSIANLTITNGSSSSGGAILNSGTLSITNSTFSNNSASGNGGAVQNNQVINSITNSTFSNNSATGSGGAIQNTGTMGSITYSTFSNNTASSSNGGAVENEGTISSITYSTFSNNTAAASGGAVGNYGTIYSITNSTFNSNSSGNTGGAIAAYGTVGNLTNSTLYSNSASVKGGGVYAEGIISIVNSTLVANSSPNGGAFYSYGNTVRPKNSLFAKGANGTSCTGTYTDKGYNLSDDSSCANGGTGSQSNVANLNLDTLKDNGGPTQTIALLSGSAAIGLVASGCPATDQRGATRPASGCDAGAYQFPATTTTGLTASPDPAAFKVSVTFTATVTTQGSGTPSGTVSFSDSVSGALGSASLSGGVATFSTANLSVGSHLITASYSGDLNFAGSTGSYTLTVTPGPPAQVVIVTGDQQSALINTTFSTALAVKVTDAYSNPISGTSVTFSAPASGPSGSFAGGSTGYTGQTGADGQLTAPAFSANGQPGSYQVSATAAGVSNPASFNLTNLACNPLQVTSNLDDGSCGTLRQALTFAGNSADPGSKTVTITLTSGSIISLTSGLTVPDGVSVTTTAACGSDQGRMLPPITLQGSGNNSGVGLTLAASSQSRQLFGLWVRGFSGQQISAPPGSQVVMKCVRVSKG